MAISIILAFAISAAELPAAASGDESIALARQLLPHTTAHRTSRYVVLADTDRELIRGVVIALEETRRQYDRWCRTLRLPPARPDDRLLCIVFHSRDDFAAFAEQTESLGKTAAHINGYFSPRFDWIVWFDPGDSDDIDKATKTIDQAEADIDAANARGVSPERVEEARRQIDAARSELAAHEYARRTEVSIHEAVHQLVHVGAAFPGRDRWPDWLHEGIAVAFETDQPRKPFGPDRDHASRADGFATALTEGRNIPLQSFLSLDHINHAEDSHVGVVYDQAGSLISWLHRRRRHDLATFLNTLGIPDQEGQLPSTETVFIETIGNVSDIERRWLTEIRETK
ncbi:MAG: DUF1570 domain-containing protein [Phycisphaerales bacterium]|nr:DUF1570 domain-containing protein [Phycisphaerales bacterium]